MAYFKTSHRYPRFLKHLKESSSQTARVVCQWVGTPHTPPRRKKIFGATFSRQSISRRNNLSWPRCRYSMDAYGQPKTGPGKKKSKNWREKDQNAKIEKSPKNRDQKNSRFRLWLTVCARGRGFHPSSPIVYSTNTSPANQKPVFGAKGVPFFPKKSSPTGSSTLNYCKNGGFLGPRKLPKNASQKNHTPMTHPLRTTSAPDP